MRLIRQLVASSQRDKQGDRFTVAALASMVDQANSAFIPYTFDHDPRIPPLGRIRKARLMLLPNDEVAVEADIEVFDEENIPPFDTTRKLPLESFDRPFIGYDANYRSAKNQKSIAKISEALGSKGREDFKKSFEPVSVFTIIGAFVIGSFSGGFFKKIGSDAWDALKSELKKLTFCGPKGQLFSFNFQAEQDGGPIIVEAIIPDPNPNDIERFFSELPELYKALKPLLQTDGLWKLVLESKGGRLKPLYGVRSDAIPIKLNANSLPISNVEGKKKSEKKMTTFRN